MKNKKKKKLKLKTKYKTLIISIVFILIIVFWARYISTSGLIIKEYKIVNSKIPSSFHGLKIVHFSDIHYGRTINEPELNCLVEKINLINPDIVLFTGDLIDRDTELNNENKEIIINKLSNIKALYGKYAISGNHDFVFNNYNEILKNSNFINLNNTYDIIYNKEQDSIFIGGLESEIDGNPNIKSIGDFKEQQENISSYKILIMHTPDTFTKIKKYNFDLVLAGHSHNGQIRLPIIGALITPSGAKKYYKPYYKTNNTDFFISSGLGTSTINFRFFNKPSINFYRITNK